MAHTLSPLHPGLPAVTLLRLRTPKKTASTAEILQQTPHLDPPPVFPPPKNGSSQRMTMTTTVGVARAAQLCT